MCSKETKRPCVDPSATGEYVAGIEDLVLQILLRLPAKSLIRFKLVSKHWQSLISDLNFVQSHILKGNRNSIIPLGMFVDVGTSQEFDFFSLSASDQEQTRYRAGPSLDFIDKAFRKLGRAFSILRSCHGLLLCCSKHYSTYFPLCVCNPTKARRLEYLRFRFWFRPFRLTSLQNNICKEVRLWDFEVEVYSSEDHRWRLLLQFNDPVIEHSFHFDMEYNSNGMYWNGGIHWVGEHSFHFDMSTESLVKRREPCCAVRLHDSNRRYRVGSRDKYTYALSISSVKLYVFELSVDYNKWVRKYSVHICDLTEEYPEIVNRMRYYGRWELNYEVFALGVVEGLKGMDTTLLLEIPKKIISYRFSDKAMKTVYELPATTGRSGKLFHVSAYPFIGTLSTV